MFGVRRFHQFLWGRHFQIRSDHKLLKYLFSPTRAVPTMASARIQRWALMLGAYHYTVEYQPGKELGHADMLSRLPLPEAPSDVPLPVEVVQLMECLQKHLSAPGRSKHGLAVTRPSLKSATWCSKVGGPMYRTPVCSRTRTGKTS